MPAMPSLGHGWFGRVVGEMNCDYSKRGYLLPEGCKDLIDVWKPKAQPAPPVLLWMPPPPPPLPPLIGELAVPERMKVCEVAALLKLRPFQIIADLMVMGIFVNVQQQIPYETITRVLRKHGYSAKQTG